MTIHGFLTEVKDFGRLYDYLDMYDEVLPVEIPGHNGEVDFTKFTVEHTQQVVLDAYDTLAAKYDKVDVVGFSMGGALATWLCCMRCVHRAVLIAPSNKYLNVYMPVEAIKFYGGLPFKSYKNGNGNLSERRKAVKLAFKPYKDNIAIASNITRTRILKYISPHTYKVFRDLMKVSNEQVESSSPIATDTMVLWGKLDELVPYKSVRFVTSHFVNAKCKVYPDIGHSMLYTNRDDVLIKDITDFLSDGTYNKKISYRV